MPAQRANTLRAQRRRDILACAPGVILQHHGIDSFGRIAQHLQLSCSALRAQVSNEAELVRLLCHTHLDDIFVAICSHADKDTVDSNPVAQMAHALLATAAAYPARHRVYLLHRFMLAPEPQNALDTLRATIDNSFHFALHAISPATLFSALREPAHLLVQQLLHAPLWWPDSDQAFAAAWIDSQVNFLVASQMDLKFVA